MHRGAEEVSRFWNLSRISEVGYDLYGSDVIDKQNIVDLHAI